MPTQPFPDLTTAQADRIKDLLHDKRARDSERALVLEGVKPVREVLDRDADMVRTIVVTPTYLERCSGNDRRRLAARSDVLRVCRERQFKKLADVVTPVGILAVVAQPRWDVDAVLKRAELLALFGEALQDPTNVGTMIRTAAALQLDAVWLSTDSADTFNPKVVRASAGTVLHMPIFTIESPSLFAEHGCAILAALPAGQDSQPITSVTQIPTRAAIAVGNESRGLSKSTSQQATLRFHIPTAHAVDSLNVAASVAIAMFYFKNLQRGS